LIQLDDVAVVLQVQHAFVGAGRQINRASQRGDNLLSQQLRK